MRLPLSFFAAGDAGCSAVDLRRPLARRMMLSSPSFLVRENAADQLEQHRNDWSYSKPVVALDVVLNLVLIGVALYAVVLSSLGAEEDDDDFALIRVWVAGYGIGCVVHVACVVAECRERQRGRGRSDEVLDYDSDEEHGGTQTRKEQPGKRSAAEIQFRRIVDCGEVDSSGGIITECNSSTPK
ncbi:hypothetical protein MLD38_000039 [Melastoma candidum]|uniref:Uncharacterized protein n=1 Tax=Melastoma candidum TaxID=119954 RepID=A0ACB9SCR3_9MYRT|nr:hypothetical protein MLD38_000039 [Melastoma candidum]